MRFVAALMTLVASASADECHDFCVAGLDPVACGFGSYCKNKHACHNLFWTSATKDSICVRGTVGCPETNIVTCTDARSGRATASTAAPPATTTTTTTTTVAPSAAAEVPFAGQFFCSMIGRAPPMANRPPCACKDGNHAHK